MGWDGGGGVVHMGWDEGGGGGFVHMGWDGWESCAHGIGEGVGGCADNMCFTFDKKLCNWTVHETYRNIQTVSTCQVPVTMCGNVKSY